MDIAANAQKRSLEAIMNSGNMGGAIRGQDYSEAAAKAAAADKINQFNAQNRMQAGMYNNDIANKQLAQKNDIAQQNYMNQMGLTAGKTGANKTAADMYMDESKTNIGGLTGAAAAVAKGGK